MPQNPLEIPVRDFPTPEILDGLIVEVLDNNKGAYTPIPVGTRIDEGADSIYAGYELVSQKTTGDYRYTQRFWVNAAVNQDLYNGSLEYSGDDHSFPIYIRDYVLRRPFTSVAVNTKLTGVLGVVVTNGGSGYATPPTVTLSGGAGSGATAQAILYRGVVVYVRILSEGTGYTSAPAVTFGSGPAAGTAFIQSTGAVLVSEKLGKLPENDPRYGLYDLVRRIYETLPGPYIPFQRYSEDRGPIQGRRRAVLNTGQVASLALVSTTGTVTTTYEGRNGSSVVLWEIEETWLFANAVTLTTQKLDPESNTFVSVARTLKRTSTIVNSSAIVTIMGTDYIQVVETQPNDALTSWEVVTTYTLPAAHSEGTQMTTAVESKPFQFPATLDVVWYLATNGFLGYNKAFVRRVPHTTETFWVFAATEPSLTLDIPVLASVFSLLTGEDNLGEIIMDAETIFYTDATVDYLASTPNLTTYLSGWVGTTGARPVYGTVRQDGNIFRWRIDRTYVQFLVQPQPTIS